MLQSLREGVQAHLRDTIKEANVLVGRKKTPYTRLIKSCGLDAFLLGGSENPLILDRDMVEYSFLSAREEIGGEVYTNMTKPFLE